MSDNAMISIYPLGPNYFCFYESPFLQHVDPISLDTIDRVDLNKKLGIFSHASHPHYDPEGNMYTIAVKVKSDQKINYISLNFLIYIIFQDIF